MQKKCNMLITNKVLKELKDGEVTKEEVVNELIANYPVTSIVEDYVTLAMETPIDCNKIVVSREEFEAIVSLFKVRGEKVVDGEIVTETRGRKRKNAH